MTDEAAPSGLRLDVTLPPFAGQIVAGSSWHFQAVLHDPIGPAARATSDALTIVFAP